MTWHMSINGGELMSENQVSQRIEALIAPVMTDLGLELYDLEYNGGIVKITVDTPPDLPAALMSTSCRVVPD